MKMIFLHYNVLTEINLTLVGRSDLERWGLTTDVTNYDNVKQLCLLSLCPEPGTWNVMCCFFLYQICKHLCQFIYMCYTNTQHRSDCTIGYWRKRSLLWNINGFVFIFTVCKFYKSLCMVLKSPPELGYVTTWLSPLPQSVLGHWQVVSGLIINVIIINLVCYSLVVYDKWMINKIWSISVSTVTDNNLRENYETKCWCWLEPLTTLIIHNW